MKAATHLSNPTKLDMVLLFFGRDRCDCGCGRACERGGPGCICVWVENVTIMPVPVNRGTQAVNEATRLDPHLPACPQMAYASPGQESRKEGASG
jgi:hypothetical protein